MDSKQFLLKCRTPKRKGFGFILAIMFVGLAAALATVAFGNLSLILDDYHKTREQLRLNALVIDVRELLDSKSQELNSAEALNLFLWDYNALKSEDGEYQVHVRIAPYQDRINFNSIFAKDAEGNTKLKQEYIRLLDGLMNNYGVANRAFLYSVFEDSVDEDLTEKESLSEIANYDSSFQNGYIQNLAQLEKIVEYYKSITGDKNIDKIPWELVFLFRDDDFAPVDCINMSKESFGAIAAINGKSFVDCADMYKNAPDLAKQYGLVDFLQLSSYFVRVEFWITEKNIESGHMIMLYDLKTKKAVLI